jgi:hypothetical protein
LPYEEADNKLPNRAAARIRVKRYELLGRYFDALAAAGKKVTLRNFLSIIMVTPDKTDINNNGGFSTDYIGANFDYVDADYATRDRIAKDHVNYIQACLPS